jgi:hypothetical protein
MNEGYLIIGANKDTVRQTNLLISSIRYNDPTRPVAVATQDKSIQKEFTADTVVVVPYEDDITTVFKSYLLSPYEKTIAFQTNQLLTDFTPSVWENLRGMNSIVILKTRHSHCMSAIDPMVYYKSSTEQKSFSTHSLINAIYFNKEQGSDYVFGLAVVIASNYDQNLLIDYFSNKENSMPAFPKYIWPEWLMSLFYQCLEYKIVKYDFVRLIDLRRREMIDQQDDWNSSNWQDFLTYWVTQDGLVKIENFIQLGLIQFRGDEWLDDRYIKHLESRFANGKS